MKKLKLFLSLSLAIVLLFAQAGFSRNLSAESISSSADVLQTEASASEEPTLATLSETELVSTPVDDATVAVSEVTETSTEVSNLVNESTASSTDTSSSETLPNTEETPSGALDPLTDLTPLEESQDNPLAMAELQMMPLALATGEIQIAVTNMVLENQDYMRAQYYEFHPLSFDWTHTGQVTAGQYFTIKIDPELNLHPNTLDQLPDLKYLETVIATPTVDIGTGTVTYTFNKQAEGLADFSGHVQINVSIKGPGDGVTFRDVNGDGINDVDANGNYKAGTKQTIHITVGDQVEAILITHIGFPTVPESIFNVNSWMNTNVLEHSIPWDPSIKGDFIQAFVEVTRNDQYQDKSLQINPPARDTKLHVFSAIDVGPFVVEAGVRITQMDGVWNLPTQTVTYTKTSTKYFSYADLGYTPGSDNFTVDFASLGYDNPKKPETTYNVEYFVHHKGSITYKDANGNSNNMASLTYFADWNYTAEPSDPLISYQDGAFWYPTRAGASADANARPVFDFLSVEITKAWNAGPAAQEDVQFVLLADGQAATRFNWATTSYVEVPSEELVLPAGETSLLFNNLPYRDAQGAIIEYTVEEINVPGFTSSSTQTGLQFNFMNEVFTEIAVSKKWVDDNRNEHPDVIVNLLADNEQYAATILNAANNWTDIFENLPKYNMEDGAEIAYTVAEEALDGYVASITGDMADGFLITNTASETINIPVKKQWVGPALSEVKVNLMADSVDSGLALTLNAANNWQGSFEVEKYDQTDGHVIDYKISEPVYTNYQSVITGSATNGYTVTNTIGGKVSVGVTKEWKGAKKDSVTIKLLANDVETGAFITLNEANKWQHTFTDLEKYKNGIEVKYSIKEDAIVGYDSTISGDMAKGFVVTNTEQEKAEPTPTTTPTPTTEVTTTTTAAGTTTTAAATTTTAATTKAAVPRTGENTSSGIVAALALIVLASTLCIIVLRRKADHTKLEK